MEEGASDDVSALSKRHLSGVAPPEDHETWLRAMTHANYREIATYLGWRKWDVDVPSGRKYDGLAFWRTFVYREILERFDSFHDLARHLRTSPGVAEELGFPGDTPSRESLRLWYKEKLGDRHEEIKGAADECRDEIVANDVLSIYPPFAEFEETLLDIEDEDFDPDPENITAEQKEEAIRHLRALIFSELGFGRAENVKYDRETLLDLQAHISREQDFASKLLDELDEEATEDVPSLRGYLRNIEQRSVDEWMDTFEGIIDKQVAAAQGAGELTGSVTIAIDGTDVPFFPQTKEDGEFDLPEGVVGTQDSHHTHYAYKHLTASAVTGERVFKLASYPLRSRSKDHFVPATKYLVERVQDLVDVEDVLIDSEFRDVSLVKWLDENDIEFVIQYPRTGDEIKGYLKEWDGKYGATDHTISPQSRDISHDVTLFGRRVHYGEPSYDTDQQTIADFGDAVDDRESGEDAPDGRWFIYITNKDDVTADNAAEWVDHYAERWGIETNYRIVKDDFLARTTSRKFSVRVFYWLFSVVFYNTWVLLDVFLRGDFPELAPDDRPVETARTFARRFLRVMDEAEGVEEPGLERLFQRLV